MKAKKSISEKLHIIFSRLGNTNKFKEMVWTEPCEWVRQWLFHDCFQPLWANHITPIWQKNCTRHFTSALFGVDSKFGSLTQSLFIRTKRLAIDFSNQIFEVTRVSWKKNCLNLFENRGSSFRAVQSLCSCCISTSLQLFCSDSINLRLKEDLLK